MDDSNRHTNEDGGKLTRPQLYMKKYRQLKDAESGRNGLLRRKITPDWLLHTKWSALKTIFKKECSYVDWLWWLMSVILTLKR